MVLLRVKGEIPDGCGWVGGLVWIWLCTNLDYVLHLALLEALQFLEVLQGIREVLPACRRGRRMSQQLPATEQSGVSVECLRVHMVVVAVALAAVMVVVVMMLGVAAVLDGPELMDWAFTTW